MMLVSFDLASDPPLCCPLMSCLLMWRVDWTAHTRREDSPQNFRLIYRTVLVPCFSVHPLVQKLADLTKNAVIVLGIFEASVLSSMTLLPPYPSPDSKARVWGVVTTGKFWEEHLASGVRAYLGHESSSSKFAGVFSTGLNAGDFHGGVSPEEIQRKLKEAAKKLLTRKVSDGLRWTC